MLAIAKAAKFYDRFDIAKVGLSLFLEVPEFQASQVRHVHDQATTRAQEKLTMRRGVTAAIVMCPYGLRRLGLDSEQLICEG